MKSGFYLKMALGNLKKNYRFFIPRILAEAGLLGVFYIVFTLSQDKRLEQVRGGNYIPTFMIIGVAVMVILSAILMFYVNSFLMKQRKREFGVYNVLGMEKRHVSRVLLHETLISSLLSVALGLVIGVLFYKLCSLLICRLLETEIVVGFYYVKAATLIPAALFFLFLDGLTYAANLFTIAALRPVELLRSSSAGEREPKVKWLMLILGIFSLGTGYYIALTTKNPLTALFLFFAAVILVIIGTYFLFVTGSIFVLKCLKKNSRYYYDKRHMPAVSGLLYRMKQNAVGLASVAILSTGVLVMISTTVSLYAGMEKNLEDNYKEHFYLGKYEYWNDGEEKRDIPTQEKIRILKEAAEQNGLAVAKIERQKFLQVGYKQTSIDFFSDRVKTQSEVDLDGLTSITFVTAEMYGSLAGEKLELKDGEIALCVLNVLNAYESDVMRIGSRTYRIVQRVRTFPIGSSLISGINSYGVILANDAALEQVYQDQLAAYSDDASPCEERIAVTFADKAAACEKGEAYYASVKALADGYVDGIAGHPAHRTWRTDSLWEARENMCGMYGVLLFLGIILGLVCLFATVLIIYYKQISEGYEDQKRFRIMQNIGMSAKEVKQTINSQVILVFFLPLVVAGIHMAFAFPILERMMQIMMLYSTGLFIISAVVVYLVFALVYTLIYTGTAKTYYKIVH